MRQLIIVAHKGWPPEIVTLRDGDVTSRVVERFQRHHDGVGVTWKIANAKDIIGAMIESHNMAGGTAS